MTLFLEGGHLSWHFPDFPHGERNGHLRRADPRRVTKLTSHCQNIGLMPRHPLEKCDSVSFRALKKVQNNSLQLSRLTQNGACAPTRSPSFGNCGPRISSGSPGSKASGAHKCGHTGPYIFALFQSCYLMAWLPDSLV